jgi:hypothetical protein
LPKAIQGWALIGVIDSSACRSKNMPSKAFCACCRYVRDRPALIRGESAQALSSVKWSWVVCT